MKEKTQPVNKEAVQMLYIELGPTEAARRLGFPIGTVTKWASRYGWAAARAVPLQRGRPAATVSHYVAKAAVADAGSAAVTPSDALNKVHQEAATRTKTALAQVTVAAAEQAAAQPPLPVQSTAQLRELTAAASRVFGWDNSAPQITHNQLVITSEQLKQIRALRTETTEEEADETSRRLATSEGREQLRRVVARELGSEQNMEQPKLRPTPGSGTYEMKIRGDGRGVTITGLEENNE